MGIKNMFFASILLCALSNPVLAIQEVCWLTDWGGLYRVKIHKTLPLIHGELISQAYPTDVLVDGTIKYQGGSMAIVSLDEIYPYGSGNYSTPKISSTFNVDFSVGQGSYDTTNIFTQQVFSGGITESDCVVGANAEAVETLDALVPAI